MRACAIALVSALAALALTADFKVGESVDILVLKDGTKVEGILVASGPKAVVIVVEGEEGPEERVIRREDIKETTVGKPSGRTKACTTDPQDGLKVVSGEGFRETGADANKSSGEAPAKGKAPQGQKRPAAKKAAGRAAPKVTADMIKGAMQKNPQLKVFVNSVGGPEKAAALIRDPDQRKRLEEMARKYKFNLPKMF